MTRIRLPVNAQMISMPCSPEWTWRAGWTSLRFHDEWLLSDGGRCTGRPRHVHTIRIGRIALPHRARTALHRSSCRRVHGGRSLGLIHGGKRRRSWRVKALAGWLSKPDYKYEFFAFAISIGHVGLSPGLVDNPDEETGPKPRRSRFPPT